MARGIRSQERLILCSATGMASKVPSFGPGVGEVVAVGIGDGVIVAVGLGDGLGV